MLSPDVPLLGIDTTVFRSPLKDLVVVGNETRPIGHPACEYGTSGFFEVHNEEVALSVIYDHPEAYEVSDELFVKLGLDLSQYRVLQRMVLRDRNGQVLNLLDLPENWISLFSVDPSKTQGIRLRLTK